MASVTISLSTEDAVNMIMGCVALINDKALRNGGGPNTYESDGYSVIEYMLAMSAAAISAEHLDDTETYLYGLVEKAEA
jgi:hypothetical protein